MDEVPQPDSQFNQDVHYTNQITESTPIFESRKISSNVSRMSITKCPTLNLSQWI